MSRHDSHWPGKRAVGGSVELCSTEGMNPRPAAWTERSSQAWRGLTLNLRPNGTFPPYKEE
jgi:hypothetical protein